MVDLIGSILRMSIRILFAAMIGYQGIQGLLVPVMDRVRNTAGSVMDTVYGSGLLIKSAVGVGGVIAIVILCLYPMMKVFLFTFLYRVAGAVAQPVSDHRIVMVLQSAATSGKLMLGYLLASGLMFLLSIVIVLVSTNLGS